MYEMFKRLGLFFWQLLNCARNRR